MTVNKKTQRKVIQILPSERTVIQIVTSDSGFYVLCNDGTVWERESPTAPWLLVDISSVVVSPKRKVSAR